MCKQDNFIPIVQIIFLPLLGAPFQSNALGVDGDGGCVEGGGGGRSRISGWVGTRSPFGTIFYCRYYLIYNL